MNVWLKRVVLILVLLVGMLSCCLAMPSWLVRTNKQQSGVSLLLGKLEQLQLAMPFNSGTSDEKFQWTIAFPDMGAYMRYNHMFTSFDTIICMKVSHPLRPTSYPLPYLSCSRYMSHVSC